MVARVLTGGQSGVDRAATDVAIELGLPYGGEVPLGGWAEDFPEPPGLLGRYPCFTELDAPDPSVRTARNVAGADAVVVLGCAGTSSPGTELAAREAAAAGIPVLEADLGDPGARDALVGFLEALPVGSTLHVAGPRESECPGCYERARALLLACAAALRRRR